VAGLNHLSKSPKLEKEAFIIRKNVEYFGLFGNILDYLGGILLLSLDLLDSLDSQDSQDPHLLKLDSLDPVPTK
jgi:hypothetical protein